MNVNISQIWRQTCTAGHTACVCSEVLDRCSKRLSILEVAKETGCIAAGGLDALPEECNVTYTALGMLEVSRGCGFHNKSLRESSDADCYIAHQPKHG